MKSMQMQPMQMQSINALLQNHDQVPVSSWHRLCTQGPYVEFAAGGSTPKVHPSQRYYVVYPQGAP